MFEIRLKWELNFVDKIWWNIQLKRQKINKNEAKQIPLFLFVGLWNEQQIFSP
jgi:hypothetical protein